MARIGHRVTFVDRYMYEEGYENSALLVLKRSFAPGTWMHSISTIRRKASNYGARFFRVPLFPWDGYFCVRAPWLRTIHPGSLQREKSPRKLKRMRMDKITSMHFVGAMPNQ